MGKVKEFRYDMAATILIEMERNDEFPMGNKYRVAKTMMEYYRRDGYVDTLREEGYYWKPTADYFASHLAEARECLRNTYGRFFEFKRYHNSLKGEWGFYTKKAVKELMDRESVEIDTRIDTFNDRADDSRERWPSIQLPYIENVPLLKN